jgi:hypothetical protein
MLTPTPKRRRGDVKPPGRLHDLLKSMIKDIGEAFDKLVHMEFIHQPYQYDVVWKSEEAFSPTHVFEVQNKGSLDGALSKLQHARDIWRCRLFLVIVDEKDRAKLDLLLKPYWEGAFHKIGKYTTVLTPEIVGQLHLVCKYKEIVRQLVAD